MRPTRDEFRELSRQHTMIPVTYEVLADRETPVTAFETLVGDADGFLLESVQGGERWAQWSFLGWDPLFSVTAHDGAVTVVPGTVPDPPAMRAGDPLAALDLLMASYRAPGLDWLPPLHSGAVGFLSYDAVRYVERLPNRPPDDRALPEMAFHVVGALAAFDRFRQTITLVRNVVVDDDVDASYDRAVTALRADAERLGSHAPYRTEDADGRRHTAPVTSTMDRSSFEAAVGVVKEHILQGDAYQVVISQRLGTPFSDDPFDIYRALRVINPSPFLFYVKAGSLAIAGSSPELMTRVRDGVVYSRPIAGTRPRGGTPEEDTALAEELLADPKERAEHVMLIDLARNDLGRVCEFGTVHVDDLMVIERYSHVMHIVSGVSGKLRRGQSPVDVIRAVFPHGTVSGAPKVRAMEIIDDLEPVARGPYAGAVGYLDFSGNVDTAICLRTVIVADGTAWVQAGAGVVADSDPASEYEETMDKAAAALAAVELARKSP